MLQRFACVICVSEEAEDVLVVLGKKHILREPIQDINRNKGTPAHKQSYRSVQAHTPTHTHTRKHTHMMINTHLTHKHLGDVGSLSAYVSHES